jgi:hypothetical protein
MRTYCILFICICFLSHTNAQDSLLVGNWKIIDFEVVSEEKTETISEKNLKDEDSVWEIQLLEDGNLIQTSNMSSTGTLDTFEGTWITDADTLVISIKMEENYMPVNYIWELKDELLYLTRNNPTGTMKLITKFRKD